MRVCPGSIATIKADVSLISDLDNMINTAVRDVFCSSEGHSIHEEEELGTNRQ